jgi:hypothetical protein
MSWTLDCKYMLNHLFATLKIYIEIFSETLLTTWLNGISTLKSLIFLHSPGKTSGVTRRMVLRGMVRVAQVKSRYAMKMVLKFKGP